MGIYRIELESMPERLLSRSNIATQPLHLAEFNVNCCVVAISSQGLLKAFASLFVLAQFC